MDIVKRDDYKIVNTKTGEVIDLLKSPEESISNLLLAIDERIKELTEVFKKSKEVIEQKRLDGKVFGDWNVSINNRETIKKPSAEDLPEKVRNKYIKAKEVAKEIEETYGKKTITQYTVWKRGRFAVSKN